MDENVTTLLLRLEAKLNAPVFDGGFDVLVSKVEAAVQKIDELHRDLNSMKDNLHHPDNGLYARVKNTERLDADARLALVIADGKIDTRVQTLERHDASRTKLFWVSVPVILALVAKAIVELVMRHVVLS